MIMGPCIHSAQSSTHMHVHRMVTYNVLTCLTLTEIIGWIGGWFMAGLGVGGHVTRGVPR
jgi:hypothetical protein